jgi:hypothetical protein
MAISANALLSASELLLDLCLAAVAGPEAPIASAVSVVNMKSVGRSMWGLPRLDRSNQHHRRINEFILRRAKSENLMPCCLQKSASAGLSTIFFRGDE